MHSIAIWPVLAVLGGVAATIPILENGSSRSVWYWWVLPPVAAGVVAVFSHAGLF